MAQTSEEQGREEYHKLDNVLTDITTRMLELSEQGGSVDWDIIYHAMKTLEELNRFLRK